MIANRQCRRVPGPADGILLLDRQKLLTELRHKIEIVVRCFGNEREEKKKLLPRNFFKDNPMDELSAARLAYTMMIAMWNDEFQNRMWDVLRQTVEPERIEVIEAEKMKISNLEDGDEIVTFIRKGYDIVNREFLCKKILTMQDDVMPPLLRRFRTSRQDTLIETTIYTLAHAAPVWIDQLIQMYPEICSPYAQSMACLVFGVQKREETMELLLREHDRLKREYPEESYDQGPLLALDLLA